MQSQYKILGDKNINRSLFNLSIPAIIGLTVVATYTMVDSIFVGHSVGPDGIAGIFIVFPFQIFIMAVAMMFGVGGGSIISRALGESDFEKVYLTLSTVIFSTLIASLIITIFTVIFLNGYLKISGAKGIIYSYANSYMLIIALGTIFFMFSLVVNSLLRAEGKGKMAMWIMAFAAFGNIFFDYIFIYKMDMGTQGAAIATVLAQMMASFYVLPHFFRHRSMVHFAKLRISIKIVKETILIGFSSFINQVSSSFLILVINNRLSLYGGEFSVSIFSIYQRVALLICMPVYGLAQGMQPIAGYHFGAKNFSKVKEVFHKTTFWATIVTTLGFIILFVFPKYIMGIFTSEPNMIEQGKFTLRILSLAYPLVGFQMIGSMGFMAIGKAKPALILNSLRQFVFLIPLVLILSLKFGLIGIFYSFPISDILAFIVTFLFYKSYIHKMELDR